MAAWWFMLLWVLGPSFANAGVMDLAKRTVLSDLSGGFCRSYRFGGMRRKCLRILDLGCLLCSGYCQQCFIHGWSGWGTHSR